MPRSRTPLEPETSAASRQDEHPGADQWEWPAGIPRPGSNARGLGQDVVTAVGDLAQLFDRFVKVAALCGVPHRRAVKGAVKGLVRVDMFQAIEQVF
jgi:hypothetical protein